TIVVDNASTDSSAALVTSEFPGVVLIQNDRNRGFAAANNQAATLAKGKYLLFLNNDTIVHPESLQTLVGVLDAHTEIAPLDPGSLESMEKRRSPGGICPRGRRSFIGFCCFDGRECSKAPSNDIGVRILIRNAAARFRSSPPPRFW